MTNRRSILQTLCTVALTLLAPIAAFAQGRKRDPRALGRDGKWHRARLVATTPDSAVWRGLPEPSPGCMCYACTEERLRVRLDAAEDEGRGLRAILGELCDVKAALIANGPYVESNARALTLINGMLARIDNPK